MVIRKVAALAAAAGLIVVACSSSASPSPSAGGAASAAPGGSAAATGCTVGVSWNNYQEERWAKWDEPAIKKALEAGGAK